MNIKNNYGGFDQVFVNKNMIAFNIQPNVNDDTQNPPYANFENQEVDNREIRNMPLVNKTGAKEMKTEITQLDANIKHPQSDAEFVDADGNDNLRAIANNKDYQITESDSSFGTNKNGDTIMDGLDSESMNDAGANGHPELYQIVRDNVNTDFMGDMDADDDIDNNSLPEDKEDFKDLEDGYKDNPKDIDFTITNKTKPIINDEDVQQGMQTVPAIVGRELTNQTVGLSVMSANNAHNRKEIGKIMKQYAPNYSKNYEQNIKPLAKQQDMEINHNYKLSRNGFSKQLNRHTTKKIKQEASKSKNISNQRSINRNQGIER